MTPATYPHVTANGTSPVPDPTPPDIPDPVFGGVDVELIQRVLGESALNVARWASYAQSLQQTVVALRAQVDDLRRQLEAKA